MLRYAGVCMLVSLGPGGGEGEDGATTAPNAATYGYEWMPR